MAFEILVFTRIQWRYFCHLKIYCKTAYVIIEFIDFTNSLRKDYGMKYNKSVIPFHIDKVLFGTSTQILVLFPVTILYKEMTRNITPCSLSLWSQDTNYYNGVSRLQYWLPFLSAFLVHREYKWARTCIPLATN